MLAYACSYLVSSHLYKWGNSYVNPYFRGEYSANKEILSLLSGVVFSLIAGKALDWFEASGNLYGGFVFITLCMLVSSICNFIALCLMKKNVKMTNEPKMKLRRIINHTLNNKQFQYIVILDIMRNIAAYLTLGFLGTFKTKDLMFSIGTVQMINIFAYICRCLVSKPFGRYADRHSYVKVLELGYIIAATAYAVNMFTSQNTRWLIVLFTVLYFISDAAINANSLNVLYSYVKSDYFAYAAAIKNSISGIFGFSASLLSSRLLQYVQSNGNSFFSLNIYGQQLLSAMSCIMFLLAFLFAKLFIEKQEIVGH